MTSSLIVGLLVNSLVPVCSDRRVHCDFYTRDASGSYNRYDFHIGSNFFDYPKIGSLARRLLSEFQSIQLRWHCLPGPQPVAFDRAKMLAGQTATVYYAGHCRQSFWE